MAPQNWIDFRALGGGLESIENRRTRKINMISLVRGGSFFEGQSRLLTDTPPKGLDCRGEYAIAPLALARSPTFVYNGATMMASWRVARGQLP